MGEVNTWNQFAWNTSLAKRWKESTQTRLTGGEEYIFPVPLLGVSQYPSHAQNIM